MIQYTGSHMIFIYGLNMVYMVYLYQVMIQHAFARDSLEPKCTELKIMCKRQVDDDNDDDDGKSHV